ncbi:Transcriptional regulator of nonfermentable carbon utilization [Coemansia javaensis]|uniref:Transcriptional regulator of nonfermentable carbon utilization n=1 Tax=Coemansia javaensis TaxID=2761396 RepID=A0A9W8HF40_9FUNG|nr:Transcriptional regulator of nonfermentable carbon utilization [Coemansia javaensis]
MLDGQQQQQQQQERQQQQRRQEQQQQQQQHAGASAWPAGLGAAEQAFADDAARRKRKTVRACIHCQRSHLTCDNGRPCARCTKRGLGASCVDGARKKAKYLTDGDGADGHGADGPPPIEAPGADDKSQGPLVMRLCGGVLSPALAPPAAVDPLPLHVTPTVTFGSETINLEYAIMSSMLAGAMAGGAPLGPPGADGAPHTQTPTVTIPSSLWAAPVVQAPLAPLLSPARSSYQLQTTGHNNGNGNSNSNSNHNSNSNSNNNNNSSNHNSNHNTSLGLFDTGGGPVSAQAARDRHASWHEQLAAAATAAAGPSTQPPLVAEPAVYGLNPVYAQRPADVYSSVTEPHQYHTGFHYCLEYIHRRMNKRDIMRVCRAIAHFRPSLVALLRNLTREDLVFAEKSLQRALLEYEKLVGFVGTPTVVWRRTGEIVLVGKEFSILTHWDRQELAAGGHFIFELMSLDSAVVYWEKFASHAFENSEHAVMAECCLLRPDGSRVPCAFSFTIKRDLFGLPMAVIGNFLPIL